MKRYPTLLLILVSLLLAGCDNATLTPVAVTPIVIATGAPTAQPTAPATDTPHPATPAPSATPSPVLATATTMPVSATPASTPTLTPPAATPTPVAQVTPLPVPQETIKVFGPLLVDSAEGRLYAPGSIGGVRKTLVFAASSARLIAAFDVTGTLGLDSPHSWLYVDRGAQGLAVLNAQTGTLLQTVALPPENPDYLPVPAPQADPVANQVLAFRNNQLYVIAMPGGTLARTVPFTVPQSGGDCRVLSAPLPIEGSLYDSAKRVLYLDFTTYTCTPTVGHSLLSYDVSAGREITHSGTTMQSIASVTAYNGNVYGTGWSRLGTGYRWAWQDGRPALETSDWAMTGGFFMDTGRGRLYEGTAARLAVYDPQTLALSMIATLPITGTLAGYDPQSDQLYFVDDGQLRASAAKDIQPLSAPPAAVPVPTTAVRLIAPPPQWPQEKTILGLWDSRQFGGPCWVIGQASGPLFVSSNGLQAWTQPRGGLPKDCEDISAAALSPDFAHDHTLFAGIVGYGLFVSIDGGGQWRPASAGLSSMGIEQILFSPGFARDRTVFVLAGGSQVYRSSDAGQHWQKLSATLQLLALSPEFEQDDIVMGATYGSTTQKPELWGSQDGGANWKRIGDMPGKSLASVLALAPLFAKWHVMFAYSPDGDLSRSNDGGAHWDSVLHVGTAGIVSELPPQLVIASNDEVNRTLYLAAGVLVANSVPPREQQMLYHSSDGGLHWAAVQLPAGLAPTALALSPDYVHDGLLFVGTSDGHVSSVVAATLKDQKP